MSRRYVEQVEVRVGDPLLGVGPRVPAGLDGAAVPTAFVWRGQLHVVREVLGHWTQRLPWWRLAAHPTTGCDPGGVDARGDVGDLGAAGDPGEVSVLCPVRDLEQRVWRVEATVGRLRGTGVYDLAEDECWRLLRVAD